MPSSGMLMVDICESQITEQLSRRYLPSIEFQQRARHAVEIQPKQSRKLLSNIFVLRNKLEYQKAKKFFS